MRSLTAAAVLVLALSGCSSDDDAGSAAGSGLPSPERLATYFEALASYNPERLSAADGVAAEGSPAADYLDYLSEYAESAIAAGEPVEPSEAKPVEDGFEACGGGTGAPEECVTWSDLQGRDGRLTGFTIDEIPLDDALIDLGDQAPIESAGLYSVQPDHAYRSPASGTLFVTLTVTAGAVPLTTRSGIYVEQDQILDAIASRGPATIDPRASTPVVLAFPDAQDARLDGQVTLELGVGGRGTESVGFGLTDPAR